MTNDVGMSAGELSQIGDLLRQMTHNVELLTQKIVFGVEYTLKSQKSISDGDDEMHARLKKNADSALQRMKRQEAERRREARETYGLLYALADAEIRKIDQLEHKWRRVGEAMKKHLSQGTGALGKTGDMMGMSGSRGLFSSAMGQIQQMSSMLPMGGLLGLALFGAMKETEWSAAAHSAGRNFAQVGSGARAATKEISALARGLGPSFGMDPSALAQELGAVASGLAAVGISGKQSAEKLKDTGDSVLKTSFALDTLFKAGTGTFAQAIGQAFESTGDTIKETTRSVRDLALSLRDTGVNVVSTIGQLMQLTMGMRVQRQGVDDLSKQYFTLSKALAAGPMAGANASALGRATMAGLQGVAAGISGASEGIMAVLGERISRRTGGQQSGIDAMIGWQEGLLGKGGPGNMMGQVVREMGAFAKEITGGGSRNEQIFALMKTNPALGFEGSRAIVEMNEQIAKGVPVEKATAEAQQALKKAFVDRAAETSEFQKRLVQLTAALATTGGGILTATLQMAQNLPNALMALGVLINPFSSTDNRTTATRALTGMAGDYDAAFERIQKGVEDAAGVYVGLSKTIFGVGGGGGGAARRAADQAALMRIYGFDDAVSTPKSTAAPGTALDDTQKIFGSVIRKSVGSLGAWNKLSPEQQKKLRETFHQRYNEVRSDGLSGDDAIHEAVQAAASAAGVQTVKVNGRKVRFRLTVENEAEAGKGSTQGGKE